MEAHKAIYPRGIDFHRIFVLQRSVINGSNREKHDLMTLVIREHKKKRLALHIVCDDQVSSDWDDPNTSFLVCDDRIASESYSLRDNGASRHGYVTYNDSEVAMTLQLRFLILKRLTINAGFEMGSWNQEVEELLE